MLSVITYNIQKGKKLTEITEWILSLKKIPDIICLQEFPFVDFENFLKEIIKIYDFDARFALGFSRKGEKFGQVTLIKKDSLRIVQDHIISLGKSAIESRVVNNKMQRTALVTIVAMENKKFILVNAHLVCLSLNWSRIRQVEKILSSVSRFDPHGKLPVVILGDFNYSTLTRQKQLVKIMQRHGFFNAYKKYTHRLFYVKHQIDYVFYKNCFVDGVDVLRLKLSDHYCISFNLDFSPKARKKVAIFDFDGTIADTIPTTQNMAALFNQFADDLGFTQRVTKKDVAIFREKSLREIISMLHIRFYKLPFILRKVQKGMREDLENAKPIVGIKGVLAALKEHGYTLGILSSSRQELVEKFLQKNNLLYFDFMSTGSSLFGKHKKIQKLLKKNHFSKEETIYIGDEIRDIEAMKKVGIHMIAATWGFNNKKGLVRFMPNFVVDKPQELLDILV